MLYLSLIFIASGIFFIIYALFFYKARTESDIESDSEDSISDAENRQIKEDFLGNDDENSDSLLDKQVDDIDITKEDDFLLDDISAARAADAENDLEPTGPTLHDELSEAVADSDTFVNDTAAASEGAKDVITEEGAASGENDYVVLYEDSSSIFDYENNNSIIDSSLSEYQKIKRIGKGKLEVTDSSVNFTIENSSFRYDYHRIEGIKTGDNYIALFIKASDAVRLFIFENENRSGMDLKRSYNNYAKAHMVSDN